MAVTYESGKLIDKPFPIFTDEQMIRIMNLPENTYVIEKIKELEAKGLLCDFVSMKEFDFKKLHNETNNDK